MHLHAPHFHWQDAHVGKVDTVKSMLVGMAALLGMLASTGVIAIIIRISSGKW
jgi:hypothetical protein